MAEVKIPIRTTYDGSGYDKLRRDSERAQKEAVRATQIQIREQQRLASLTRRLDRDLARDAAGAKPSFQSRVAGGVMAGAAGVASVAAMTQMARTTTQTAAEMVALDSQADATWQTFVNLSGGAEEASANMEALDRATKNLISDQKEQEIANQLLAMQIVSTGDELEKVVGVSRRLGKEIKGIGAAEAAENFALMISNMAYARLDTFGISSGAVRKRVNELADAAGRAATQADFFQATMEEADKVMAQLGPEVETTADKTSRLNAEWTNLKTTTGDTLTTLADTGGILDAMAASLDGANKALKGFNDASKALDIIEEKARGKLNPALKDTLDTLDVAKAVTNPFAFAMEKVATYLGTAAVNGEGLAEAYDELNAASTAATTAADDNTAATEDNTEAQDELLKRLERVRGMQRDAVGEMLDIEEQAAEDSAQAWQDWGQDVSDLNADTWQRIEQAQEDSAKRQKKIAGDLQKDLTKNTADLGKDLAKLRQDTDKRVTRAQEDAAREERNEERMSRLDALADERLFQFQLRQLAADGQGIAIQQALEQREIEQQIEAEKAAEQARIKDEERAEDISRIREDAAEQETELRARAEERRDQLIQEASEEQALREEQLAEQLAAENEAYDERRASLDSYREDKLATIEDSKQEAVEALAEELARSGEMTEEELGKIAVAAGRIGVQAGTAFAYGLSEGMSAVQRISELLGEGGGGTAPAGGDSGPGATMERDVPGYATGGSFLVGGSGGIDSQLVSFMATPGERVTVSPPGQQGGINITANGVGADLLAAILQRKVDEALAEYHETVLVPFSQGM